MRLPSESLHSVVVLECTSPPDGTTRYIDQVVTYADPRFEFRYLSPTTLLRRVDVLHVHWPEVIARGRNAAETAMRCLMLRVALGYLRLRGTAIVRTLHNVSPHEPGNIIEQRTLAHLDAATNLFVIINPVTEPPHGPAVFIPHGHYRDRFASHPKPQPVRGRLVYAGLIRPYKGVEQLIECFRRSTTPSLSLRIVGRPTSSLRVVTETAAAEDERISFRFGFLPDEDFVAEVAAAELLCLPYRELHNSGMALVALSLDRPVLVPDTPTTRALADEVGPGWVHRFSGRLTAEDIDRTVDAIRAGGRLARPRLEDRDWTCVAHQYGNAFLEGIRRKAMR